MFFNYRVQAILAYCLTKENIFFKDPTEILRQEAVFDELVGMRLDYEKIYLGKATRNIN
jgi:hypothetical protein